MDEELDRTPQYLQYFDLSDTGFPWREPRPDEIVRRRADMNDKFIFDVLLASGGIEQPEVLYPPRNVGDLKALLFAIEDSTYDTLKKECLVYYLLKWHQDGREERFQLERSIPPQFTALADAYWHLDTGINVPRAVALLSDNRLNREFVSKILHAISISPNPSPLIVQYVRTAKPLLTTPQDVWTYMLALADLSFLEAWRFQRTFNETAELRRQLLEKLFEWCISPDPRPDALSSLLCFPLSPFEEQFLHTYALDPPKYLSRSSIAILRDLICVRLIQSGKYADAIKVDHQFASSTLNDSQDRDRRKMVQDLYDALPPAERAQLDSELTQRKEEQQPEPAPAPTVNGIQPPPPTKPTTAAPAVADISMSQSWEEIPRPLTAQKLASALPTPAASPFRDPHPHPHVPLPERAGAPRFGGPIPTLSASTTAAPPILPISQPQPLASATTTHPRKSLGAPFFPATSTSKSTGFASAARKPNAFYKPPPPATTQGPTTTPTHLFGGATRVEERAPRGARAAMDVDGLGEEQEDGGEEEEHMHMEVERETTDQDVGFSVFGNTPGPVQAEAEQQAEQPRVKTRRAAAASSVSVAPQRTRRRAPPGAFDVSDEEEEDAEVEAEAEEPAPPPVSARTRTSARHTQTNKHSTRAPQPEPPRNKRARRVQEDNLGRSLPGSLMDEDQDEEEEEEEEADDIAPLKQPTRRAAARTSRARATTPLSDAGDELEGVQTRRRSSRLSTAGSVGAEPPKKGATGNVSLSANATANTKGRKSTRAAAGGTKKKR